MEDNEALYELFNIWYGFSKFRKRLSDYSMTPSQLRHQWDELWFAKTSEIDVMLRDKFHESLRTTIDYVPKRQIEEVGKMLMYDQVVRNIFRGTPQAYQYDHISLKIAHKLVKHDYNTLPCFVQISVVLVLIHSENITDQNLAVSFITQLFEVNQHHYGVLTTLQKISQRHKLRIELFGRFPERSKIKGLVLSEDEKTFVSSLS